MNDLATHRADRVERSSQATTLPRHAAVRAERAGDLRLAGLVNEIALAAKVVARETRHAALHQTTPLALGSAGDVDTYERFLAEAGA